MAYDCTRCGACCCNPHAGLHVDYESHIALRKTDALHKHPRLVRRLTVTDEYGVPCLRLVGKEQRCIALAGIVGEAALCAIYPLRPQLCMEFQPGNALCREARREHGLEK